MDPGALALTGQETSRWPRPLEVPEREARVFRLALQALDESGVPYSVGGAFALYFHAGIRRKVKDLDIHVVPRYVDRVLAALQDRGFTTRMKHYQWLAQAFREQCQVDVVFGMGNWLAAVDDDWIERGRPGQVLGRPVIVAPVEEIIWSKAFMCSRERYDAADIFHLLISSAHELDWSHLLARFDGHWEVLLSHLIMFRYVFPSHARLVPDHVLDGLLRLLSLSRQRPWHGGRVCRGTLVDGAGAYYEDVTERGYRDVRQELWERRQRREGGLPGLRAAS